MGGSGLIFAGIVVLWIAFLVPMLLRRHDRRSDARAAEGFSAAMRVLARRQPVPSAVAARRTRREDVGTAPRSVRSGRRAPSAVSRRRMLLLGLLLLLAATVVVAVLGRAPVWAPALPVLLLFGYLALLLATANARPAARRRTQRPIRRVPSRRAPRARPGPQPTAELGAEPAAVPVAALAVAEPAVRVRHIAAEVEPVVLAEPGQVAEVPAAVHDPNGWAPVPVPLPTYVTAPKAPRTIRTIDLRSPGAWTSGPAHDQHAAPQPVPAAPVAEASDEPGEEHRRAVGD